MNPIPRHSGLAIVLAMMLSACAGQTVRTPPAEPVAAADVAVVEAEPAAASPAADPTPAANQTAVAIVETGTGESTVANTARHLRDLGVVCVGVDYLSVEQFRSPHHRTHKTLLSNGIVIVEGLVLAEPPAGDYELYCLPMLMAGLDGAPARAVLIS